jgi:hypothetical protein
MIQTENYSQNYSAPFFGIRDNGNGLPSSNGESDL